MEVERLLKLARLARRGIKECVARTRPSRPRAVTSRGLPEYWSMRCPALARRSFSFTSYLCSLGNTQLLLRTYRMFKIDEIFSVAGKVRCSFC